MSHALPARHPLLERLGAEHGFPELTAASFDAFISAPGHALVFFSEDPVRQRETLDLAVILPELHRAFGAAFRACWLAPDVAKAIFPRYGFRRWPAFVLLRGGEYVGVIDGVRGWDEYVSEMQRLLAAEPTAPPAIVTPARPPGRAAGGGASRA
jgi:hydrogenase-1 operon protein HyaE